MTPPRATPAPVLGTLCGRVKLLALGLSLGLWTRPARAAGVTLATAPSVAPGTVPPDPADRLALARERWRQGDAAGTVTALDPWLDERRGPYGRTRTAGQLLMGMAQMHLENWNLASTNFYLVRRSDSPLAPWGAWNEAVVDHKRGRQAVAIRECNQYRERWPEGQDADECLILQGQAWAALGKPATAIASFQAWLDHNPDTPRTEEVALAKALAVAHTSPKRGIPMLQELVLDHTFPSTAVGAQQALAELFEGGQDVTMPSDIRSRIRYATSLRRSGKLVEAWTLFEELQREADEMQLPTGDQTQTAQPGSSPPVDPFLVQWVEDNQDRFSWGTRQFEVYLSSALPRYEESPSSSAGWRIFRAYARGGLYTQAAAWGARMQTEWGARKQRDAVAWAHLHAGKFEEARERFLELGKSGGKTGREARFYAAYAALQAGLLDDAVDELGALADGSREDEAKASYWRSVAHSRMGAEQLAEQWQERALRSDQVGWYRMLIETQAWRRAGSPLPLDTAPAGSTAPSLAEGATQIRTKSDRWLLRDGSWHGHINPFPPTTAKISASHSPQSPTAQRSPDGALSQLGLTDPRPATDADGLLWSPPVRRGWEKISWPRQAADELIDELADERADEEQAGSPDVTRSQPQPQPQPLPLPPYLPLPVSQERLPDGYGSCVWYDPASAQKTFANVSEHYVDVLPDLPAAFDLSRAGASVQAGRIVRDAFETWSAARDGTDELSLRLRELTISDWREIALFARQPNVGYRLCIGLSRKAATPDDAAAADRLAFPLVRTAELWRLGQTYDLDPFLMMAIMRQESRYQATVISHAGAIGLVQVMPRTGAKVAALLGEGSYSPADLEEPATNLRYGSYYLSLLLQRFGGCFPLAVASYNGGPHNVSRWLQPWLARPDGIPLDAFVEQIEYDESRDYVKKVSSYYDAYAQLYGPPGSRVVLPLRPEQDDPSVVDF